MEISERYAYRARGVDPLVEVEVLRVGTARPLRVRVRWCDDDAQGRTEWVPPNRLKCPWVGVDEFRREEARWARLADTALRGDPPEYWAATRVMDLLVDSTVAELVYRCDGAARIRDVSGCAALADIDSRLLSGHPDAFEDSGGLVVPWPTTLMILRAICVKHADVVLAAVSEDQRTIDRESMYGRLYRATRGHDALYITAQEVADDDAAEAHGKASRDVIRAWCGASHVDRQDELIALRAEVYRLGALIEQTISDLRTHGLNREAVALARQLGVPVDTFRTPR